MLDFRTLAEHIRDARNRTLALMSDLSDAQMLGEQLEIVNPPLWEIGHCAWFQERWTLRHLYGRDPLRRDADQLYDSARVAHDTRWKLPLYTRSETLRYMQEVLEASLEELEKTTRFEEDSYFYLLSLYHEDMHTEAFTYTRQTHAYPAPRYKDEPAAMRLTASEPTYQDVEIPETEFLLGSRNDGRFVFDNEQWAHPVRVARFRIAREAVTNAQFSEFVDDGGYRRSEFWSPAGWSWKQESGADHPVYWKCSENNRWLSRHFDRWLPLEPNPAVIHVNWYEAEAYCKWAGRRLPAEAEWELAATGGDVDRTYPWGTELGGENLANLNWNAMGVVPVSGLPLGDSPVGCRQMLGNVWEWMGDDFLPYPGFEPGPYREYSQPWFETHKVLRGGSWATRSRLIRSAYRNFYKPDRRDVLAGFRTCAQD